jgi:[protein-PII] uridylyltransferase
LFCLPKLDEANGRVVRRTFNEIYSSSRHSTDRVAFRLLEANPRMSKARNPERIRHRPVAPFLSNGRELVLTRAEGLVPGVLADDRHRCRARLYTRLRTHPVAGLNSAEIDAHFHGMPTRYWERVNKAELIWGLETIRAFTRKLEQQVPGQGLVAAEARHYPERGLSKVMICTWDHPGLLAKMAAAFSALRVNVLRADVYTRADHLALDLFEVTEIEDGRTPNSNRLASLIFLLEGALSQPPRFASVWATEFHKVLPRTRYQTPRVEFDNDQSREHTLIRLEASDRLGLLHDVLQSLTDCEVDIAQAIVETENAIASDLFFVTDFKRRKILDPVRLEGIRQAMVQVTS